MEVQHSNKPKRYPIDAPSFCTRKYKKKTMLPTIIRHQGGWGYEEELGENFPCMWKHRSSSPFGLLPRNELPCTASDIVTCWITYQKSTTDRCTCLAGVLGKDNKIDFSFALSFMVLDGQTDRHTDRRTCRKTARQTKWQTGVAQRRKERDRDRYRYRETETDRQTERHARTAETALPLLMQLCF